MDHDVYLNFGLAIAGIIMGILAARARISHTANGAIKNGMTTLAKFESETYAILRNMRSDMDSNFELMREQHAEMLRRLRKHDDDLFEIRTRLEKLESKR